MYVVHMNATPKMKQIDHNLPYGRFYSKAERPNEEKSDLPFFHQPPKDLRKEEFQFFFFSNIEREPNR